MFSLILFTTIYCTEGCSCSLVWVVHFWHDFSYYSLIKLARLKYKLLTTGQHAYLHMLLHHYTLHALYSRQINFSLTYQDFPLNLVKDRLVTWLLQSGMDYLLISDFHPLLTPSNVVWKLTFSNSLSTPLPCCPPSDCQRLWFSIITELPCVINACIIIIIIVMSVVILSMFIGTCDHHL